MRLRVLADNNTFIDHYYLGEPAASYAIEDEDQLLLFDTGYSDVFMRNAASMGVNLDAVSTVVLSHGHNDHTRGLSFLLNEKRPELTVVGHPHVFKERFESGQSIGSPLSEETLSRRCTLRLSRDPVQVSPNLVYLGEIPRVHAFESSPAKCTILLDGVESPDHILDDSALVYTGAKGLFIISGCSHAGICNIIERAKEVCGEERIHGVLGGFHLFDVSERVAETIRYFQRHNINSLYPCHCVSFSVRAEIHRHIPVHEVGVGLTIEVEPSFL